MTVKFTENFDTDQLNMANIKRLLRNQQERSLQKCSGNLNFFTDMPMMTTDNSDVLIGVANGTRCNFGKILEKHTDSINYMRLPGGQVIPWWLCTDLYRMVLKHVDPNFKDMKIIEGLPGFFTLKPINITLNFQWQNMPTEIKASGKQFPVVPALAITGHKVQGATIQNILITSFKGHKTGKTGWLYVVLSRVKSLKNIFLVEKLDTHVDNFAERPKVSFENERLLRASVVTSRRIRAHFGKNKT